MDPSQSQTNRTLSGPEDLGALRFDDLGLIPVVVQDASSGSVLMLAWANREALDLTLSTGETHFWSRSREELWRKGATSGNTQRVVSLHADCDGDTVLARVVPAGPACHTGESTCFGKGAQAEPPEALPDGRGDTDEARGLVELWSILESRARERPEGSYTVRLLDDENLRTKKLGEEAAELILALGRGEAGRIAEEGADLVYHLLVALLGSGVSLQELLSELEKRRR